MPQPNKIPRPFADSGDKNNIPDISGSIGFASWQEGFPAITSEPFAQGGVAPKRADFNGIFNALSAATFWQQQGGIFAYDNTTDYEIGNVVVYGGDIYICITANGPNSTVVAPTNVTTWKKLILTNATSSAAGYMSATDKTTLDGMATKIIDSGLASNEGWIRFANKIQIVWGKAEILNDGTGEVSVNFAKPFSSTPQIFGTVAFAQFYTTSVPCVQTRSRTSTGFIMCLNRYNGTFGVSSGGVSWVAIGAWS